MPRQYTKGTPKVQQIRRSVPEERRPEKHHKVYAESNPVDKAIRAYQKKYQS